MGLDGGVHRQWDGIGEGWGVLASGKIAPESWQIPRKACKQHGVPQGSSDRPHKKMTRKELLKDAARGPCQDIELS